MSWVCLVKKGWVDLEERGIGEWWISLKMQTNNMLGDQAMWWESDINSEAQAER